jgi:hypothetical protein
MCAEDAKMFLEVGQTFQDGFGVLEPPLFFNPSQFSFLILEI